MSRSLRIPACALLTLFFGMQRDVPVERLIAAAQRPDSRVNQYLSAYHRLTLDTQQVEQQVRSSGRLLISGPDRTFELDLEPHDLRSPDYMAEEVDDFGVTRRLEREPPRTFRGTVSGLEGAQARFTIAGDFLEGLIITSDEWYFIEPLRNLDSRTELTASDFVVYKASDVKAGLRECGTALPSRLENRFDQVGTQALKTGPGEPKDAVLYTADIATEADNEFVAALGSSSNANSEILSILNQVDGIYQAELSIALRVTYQHTWVGSSDPFTASGASELLTELSTYWNGNLTFNDTFDLVHLWTGRNLDGSTAGVAYRGVVCKYRATSYGLSQRDTGNIFRVGTPTHEIGHNFGASHPDTATPPATGCDNSIMSSSVGSSTQLSFCTFSRDEISTHLSTYSACLVAPASSLPDLVVTSLTAPTSAIVGGSINISAQIRNDGSAAAGAFRVELLLSTDSTITWADPDTGRGCSFDALPPGARTSCSGSVPLPSSAGPGTYFLGVMVDYLGAVIESNDSNNTRAADTGALVITEATSCTYALSAQAQSFPASGGAGSVNVTTIAGCNWTAASNASWLSISSGGSGSGNGTVNYNVAANSTSSSRSANLTIGGQTFAVTQAAAGGTAQPYSLFVPIVLSVAGLNNSFFTTELTLTNRGSTTTSIAFEYTAAFESGTGTASTTLPAGRQQIFSNAIEYLRGLGIPIPASGNRGGTLWVRFSGIGSASDVAVSARTTTVAAGGRAGLAYAGVSSSGLLNGPSYICGLRQNSADRSNLALQNAGTASEGNITLQVTVYNGQTGVPTVLPVEVLSPGEFRQLSGVLALQGLQIQHGYVRVERISGSAPFYAYGVINDQVNSDGSFVGPILESSLVGKSGLTLPVIVESGTFVSEVVVTNWSSLTKTIVFEYTADAVQAADKTARFSLSLPPGRQFIDPNLVQGLRSASIPGIGPAGPVFVGSLFASVPQGDVSGISLAARTATPGGGGKLGLFYSAIAAGGEATTSAWAYGLQQNAENRTNLAIVNTGLIDRSTDVFTIELYDGGTGTKVATVGGISVAADAWMQIGTILAQYAPGTTQGYARVTRTSGTNPFIVYAVINDGGQPGERSGDGAFISSSP